MRNYKHRWVGLARHLTACATPSAPSPKSVDRVFGPWHVDDAQAVQLPNFTMEETERCKYRYGLNGQAHEPSGACTALLSELGSGSKDANSILSYLLVNLLQQYRGEKVAVYYFDNAALQVILFHFDFCSLAVFYLLSLHMQG